MKDRVQHNARHLLREDYFRKWSNEMAYILGLLASDGCVMTNSTGTNATIRFVSKDLELLEIIHRAWGTTMPIIEEEKQRWKWHGYRIEVYSKSMAGDLALLGVGVRKTFRSYFPPMPAKYKSHFIRGLLDGDGCIWTASNNRKIRIMWAGNKEVLESISNHFATHLKIRLQTVRLHSTGRIYELIYCKRNEVLEIIKYLYTNSDSIRLGRKFKKAQGFFGDSFMVSLLS